MIKSLKSAIDVELNVKTLSCYIVLPGKISKRESEAIISS